MVDLDDPIIVLGGLFWAGENKRKFTGGLTGRQILAGGFGASSAAWAGDQLQDLIGSGTLTDDLAQALAGAAISEFGDPIPMNKTVAAGIHYNVAKSGFDQAGLSAGSLLSGSLNIGGGGNGGSEDATADTSTQTQTQVQTAGGDTF